LTFNNIARQPEDAIENLLAKKQLNIKENNSTSWFVTIKKKLYKYDLPNPSSNNKTLNARLHSF
jgi:hypothetical protein